MNDRNYPFRQPYTVQRGIINRPLQEFKGLRLHQAVDLDYMGAAEFEFGALPKSLRMIEATAQDLKLEPIPGIEQDNQCLLLVHMLTPEQLKLYIEWLTVMWSSRWGTPGWHMKEATHFYKGRKEEQNLYKHRSSSTDFWWDIRNHTMWSFDSGFMNNIVGHLAASINYMNEQRAA